MTSNVMSCEYGRTDRANLSQLNKPVQLAHSARQDMQRLLRQLPSLLLLLLLLRLPSGRGILWGSSCTQNYLEERGSKCAFPSRGPEGYISECKHAGVNWWCPTTLNYCTDGAYAWCPDTRTTYGGTDPGRECHLPFWYKGVEYRHCVRLDTRGENYLWCSTTPGNYTGRWTRCRELPELMPCHFQPAGAPTSSAAVSAPTASIDIDSQCIRLSGVWSCLTALGAVRPCEETPTTEAGNDPGRPCHFPFRYGGVWRTECLRRGLAEFAAKTSIHKVNGTTTTVSARLRSDSDSSSGSYSSGDGDFQWCATTNSYDRDRLWTRCKQPEPAARLTGFSLLLVAVSGLVATACVAACVLYCLCEPAAPCRRCRLRGGSDSDSGIGVRNAGLAVSGDGKPATAAAARVDARLRLWQRHHQLGGSHLMPSAPPPPPIFPPQLSSSGDNRHNLQCGPPSYEEVLALTAACGNSGIGHCGERATAVSVRVTGGVPA